MDFDITAADVRATMTSRLLCHTAIHGGLDVRLAPSRQPPLGR